MTDRPMNEYEAALFAATGAIISALAKSGIAAAVITDELEQMAADATRSGRTNEAATLKLLVQRAGPEVSYRPSSSN